ncbi:MAG: Gldg family protein, partial [Ardenticatenaceae bacterium]
LQPIATDLFGTLSYYLHMILQSGDEAQLLAPSGDLSEANVRTTIESALKRQSDGFLKVVGLWTPPATPTADPFGQQQPSLKQYTTIAEQLRQDYTVQPVDLTTGQVPVDVDVLVVVAPQAMTERERYAIDQYLMRGGSIVLAAGNYALNPDPMTGDLGVQQVEEGLRDMLLSYGIDVQQAMVMDPQNEPFPVQVARNVGGLQVREIQAMNYPFFVDVRANGMDKDSPILASVPAVTMNWVSPVVVADGDEETGRAVTTLLRSSPGSWLRTNTDIQPNTQLYPETGFPVEGEPQSYPLAVSVQGVFDSYFKDKPIPSAEAPATGDPEAPESSVVPTDTVGTLVQSPESARLVVIGSAEFLNDIVFQL